MYNGRLLVYQNDLNKSCDQQTNVTPPKIPPDIAKSIDESNYVKLSSITTAIAAAASENRVIQRNESTNDGNTNELHENDKINELDDKAMILHNFYANNTNGYNNNNSKAIMSIVNQKNLNNLNNIFNNNTNNLLNNSDFTKLNVTNGNGIGGAIDYNQNGLPSVIPKAPPMPETMTPISCDNTNKFNASCNGNAQANVIKSNGSNDIVNGDETLLAALTNDAAKGRIARLHIYLFTLLHTQLIFNYTYIYEAFV